MSAFFTTKTKGAGLGLTLCKEVITRHYGTITFNSSVGIGTIFI
ncbi:MAG: sensor histidine kinase, partial [Asgard group archaeon]|nr:sensor histidine kinase [Asgard group archaeon]